MPATPPVRRYVRVWVMRRKNNARKGGKSPTVSYTLQWVIYGKKQVMSLGPGATIAYARRLAAEKERELNDPQHSGYLDPVTWKGFRAKYLDLIYPGHDRAAAARKEAAASWPKGVSTMLRERAAMDAFERAGLRGADPWCHEIPVTSREAFINGRLAERAAAATAESDLGTLRYLFGLMEEWRHRPRDSNPFAGQGKSSVGGRRRAAPADEGGGGGGAAYYTLDELRSLLSRADAEAACEPESWAKKRLRALVYFEAYVGCRIREALYLDWDEDVDIDAGIAWLRHKRGNRLKTASSAAPVGLPDPLVRVLRDWRRDRRGPWVFPNGAGKPWVTAGPGYKHLDQLKALAVRAGVGGATWKKFRHSWSTLSKGHFGLTEEQVRAQLRHTSTDTQAAYTHDDLASLRAAARRVDFAG